MKKSNVIILAVLAVAAGAFLWLWYYLQFNLVDNPFDLILAIIWWAVVAIVCVAIHKVEQKRQRNLRTCYVAEGQIYNPELGMAGMDKGNAADSIQGMLQKLKYGFDIQESLFGKDQGVQCKYVVRSSVFQVEGDEDGNGLKSIKAWKGEVLDAVNPCKQAQSFSNKDELAAILTA